MAETFQLDIVSPDRLESSEQVTQAVIPGSMGDFGVLPRHAPLISTLRPGILTIFRSGGVTEKLFVSGGFAEVNNNRCTVLADRATKASEIDRTAVQQKITEISGLLADSAETEKTRLQRDLAVYEAMLRAVA